MHLEQLLIGAVVAINIVAFALMAKDKRRSMRGGGIERIPEGVIFFVATTLGSIGIYVGMLAFRHKTQKWYFQIGIPLLILQNVAVLYVMGLILGM